mmetsp:Transcript_25985/g.47492  ORF Transcript_25985/g.47492 Transcript_25985/m.47492 type:complete len:303 (-) Transcript_25985:292-1200(-)
MGGKGKGKGKGKAPPAKGKGKGKGSGKAEPSVMDVPIGTELTALWDGEWYKAKVLEVSKKKGQVKVRYNGYTATDDTWLGPDQLRSKFLKEGGKPAPAPGSEMPAVGAKCQAQIEPGGKFEKAEIVAVKPKAAAPVKVRLEVWLPMLALKGIQKAVAKAAPAATPEVTIGMEVTAQFSDGKYYKATIVKKRKGNAKPYKVHYTGHADGDDRWVSLEEIRSKALKGKGAAKGESTPEPKGKGKGKGKGKEMPEKGKGKGKGKGKMEPEPPSKGKGKGKGKDTGKGKGKGKGSKGKGKGKGKGK